MTVGGGDTVQVRTAADELASEYQPYSRYTDNALQDAFHPLIERRIGPMSAGVDVGAGTGIPGRLLRSLLPDSCLWAVDCSQEMLDKCAASGTYDRYIRASASDLPLRSSSTDFVVSVHAVHLFDDKRLAVREMARITKPGGIILLITNVPSDLKTQLFHQMMPRFSEHEIRRHFDREDVVQWAKLAGLRLLGVRRTEYCVAFQDREELRRFLMSRPFFGLRLLAEQEISADLAHCQEKVESLDEGELCSPSALTTFILERIAL
jgi:SAM-dependent methyltransferase